MKPTGSRTRGELGLSVGGSQDGLARFQSWNLAFVQKLGNSAKVCVEFGRIWSLINYSGGVSVSVEQNYYTSGIMAVHLTATQNITPALLWMSSCGTFNQAFSALKVSFLSPWNTEAQGISIRPFIDCKLALWVTSQSLRLLLIVLSATLARRCEQRAVICCVFGQVFWRVKSNNWVIRPRRFETGSISAQGRAQSAKSVTHTHVSRRGLNKLHAGIRREKKADLQKQQQHKCVYFSGCWGAV